MQQGTSAPAASDAAGGANGDGRRWAAAMAPYRQADARRSLLQLATTLLPLAVLWLTMVQSLQIGYWLTLLLAVPAAGLLVRLFMIQHDCGHGSFFKSRWANDAVGRILGTFTLTPYLYWKTAHAMHHATTGNLDRRGTGDIDVLTVAEYRALSRWKRFVYRLYRHPLILFGLGPIYLFIIKHRLPFDALLKRRKVLLSVLLTNLGILGLLGFAGIIAGWRELLLVQAPITVLASSIGVWLFYVQHQFETAYWQPAGSWSFAAAAIHGSSYYELPKVLMWFTANIGIHHIHHLCTGIPNYRLGECLAGNPEFRQVNRITLAGSLRCIRLALWDERQGRMVGFRALR